MFETFTKNFYTFDNVKREHHQEAFPVVITNIKEPNHLLHSHEFIEVVIVNSGCGEHVTETFTQPLASGDVFVIPRDIKHSYINVDNLNITNIIFQMSTINNCFPDIKLVPGFFSFFIAETATKKIKQNMGRLLNLDNEEFAHVKSLQKKIKQEQCELGSGANLMCLFYLGEILIYLSRLLEQRKENFFKTSTYSKLSDVHDYINNNFNRKITIKELAAIACMSPRNFQRIFAQMNDLSPTRYLLKIRLEKARNCLKNTSWEISNVAFESGFQESSYFTRQFKKAFGVCPRQYRNIVKNRNS